MLHLPRQLFPLRRTYPAKRSGDISGDGHQFLPEISQARFQYIKFLFGTAADQHVDGADALTLKQFDNQVLADKAGTTGNEIVHRAGPFLSEV